MGGRGTIIRAGFDAAQLRSVMAGSKVLHFLCRGQAGLGWVTFLFVATMLELIAVTIHRMAELAIV